MPICPAVAADGIGNTSDIKNQVQGILAGDSRKLETGSSVYQDELLRTGDASDVKVIFLDDTNLSLGPKSEVTLDRFVYDPENKAGAVVVRTARGIFRFITGAQAPQNYLIQTPIATIGVRGTVFDMLVRADRMTVILRSGQVLVTTLQNRVVSLTEPGTSITVLLNGTVVGPSVWRGTVYVDFASTRFPYFGPVTETTKSSPVRAATTAPQTPVTTAPQTPLQPTRQTTPSQTETSDTPQRTRRPRLSSRDTDDYVREKKPRHTGKPAEGKTDTYTPKRKPEREPVKVTKYERPHLPAAKKTVYKMERRMNFGGGRRRY